ncbi:LysR substrate-binding domain-containing protein [Pendulispora rubella]|uniref:LysR substrate-binding domain-containing protein n=1 Tax=Pendulispora rubella TaxID=2741070 RepID=A0ABZ2KT65_9BACT
MRTIGLDLNAVAVFLEVIHRRSFRAAAMALGMPKSTVSQKVAQLEERLGVRLLDRTTRTIRITEAGEAYRRRVEPALDAVGEAERAVSDLQAAPSGRLRITTTVDIGQNAPFFAEVLSIYMQRYPAVELNVDLFDRRVNLLEEGFDLAIRPGSMPDSTLIARKIGSVGTMRLYASPAYLERKGKPRTPAELREHDCMVMTSHSEPRLWTFRGKRKPVAIEVQPHLAINGFLVLRAVAEAGAGIARLPEYLGEPSIERGTLRSILDDFALPPSHWYAVYPSARNLSPKIRAFVELLEEKFRPA